MYPSMIIIGKTITIIMKHKILIELKILLGIIRKIRGEKPRGEVDIKLILNPNKLLIDIMHN
jgi:hypothetical protein